MADTIPSLPSTDPLINRFFLSPSEKQNIDKGKLIVKAFYSQQTSNDSSLSFFKLRNQRWIELLLWCKGSQKVQEFLDYMNVTDANKAWVNIDMTPTRLAAQFMGTLVESMAKNRTYPCVTAIDDGSVQEKQKRMFDALYRMHDVGTINQLQQSSGMMIEPPNAYVPDDEMAAKVYFEIEDRLPKEIRFDKMLIKLMNDICFENVVNRKTLFDLTVLNAGFTKIERIAPKQYSVRKCIPTNTVFNFFMNDTGTYEIDQIGEFYNLKVKDFRSKFPNLSEKQVFDLAKSSTMKSIGTFNFIWNDSWAISMNNTYNYNRPYDDCSILVLDCEINCGEDVYYVEKPDGNGKTRIDKKNGIPYAPQVKKDGSIIEYPKPDDVNIIKRQRNPWMRGVYAPYGDIMLYWGEPDLIVSNYTDHAKPLSSYSANIPFNDGEYVPSLFERIIEPLKEYQITKLKRKQLIANLRPAGIRIDVESARNIDLGNGDTIAWEEVLRIYNQTGNEIYSSRGVDPLQKENAPISPTVGNSEAINNIIGLTNILAGIVLEIRQLVGVSQYRDGSDVGDRTAARLAEGQNQASYNVSDYVLNANNQLWEETFYKICLLHWADIVKEEPESKSDMLNTRFDLKIKTKSTDYEKQQLENDIQRYSQMPDAQGNPSVTLKDAMMIREIDDYRLACWYLSSTFESNRQKAIQQSQMLQEQNQKLQQESAQQAQQQAMALQQQKLQSDEAMAEAALRRKKEEIVTEGIMTMVDSAIKAGTEIPPEWKQVAAVVIANVTVPLQAENQQQMNAIIAHSVANNAAMQGAQQPEEQQESPPPQMQQQPPAA